MCPLFGQKYCHQCLRKQIVIYLRPIIGYQSGEKISGCLKILGWVILRGVGDDEKLQNMIEGIENSGKLKIIAMERNKRDEI